ncbi:primase-helicase family protein [candidate division KSB1 bacterium]
MSKHEEQSKKESFSLKLSVSIRKVETKKDGEFVTEFEVKEYDSAEYETLRSLFSSNLQSTNLWENGNTGHCSNENYSGMTGVMLDFDCGVTIEEIRNRCNKYHHIFYTSTSHRTIKDSNGKLLDKFRVVLPFSPEKYNLNTTIDHHAAVYNTVNNEFPEIDSACKDPARKFFPSVGDKGNFEFYINTGVDYFQPNFSGHFLSGKNNNTDKAQYFKLDNMVFDKNDDTHLIKDIKTKTIIYCPFCDPKERGNPDQHNAFIDLNNKGVPYIFCSSCQSRGRGVKKSGVYNLDNEATHKLEAKKLNTIIFRDILSDKYFLGEKSRRSGLYGFNAISKQNIKNALLERGMTIPDVISEAEHIFDFTSEKINELEKGFVNRYIVPEILTRDAPNEKTYQIPEYTNKLMLHICGDDTEVFNSLINHLALMVQKRDKLRIAFLFQGVPGTGKGMWFNHVLAPIFGRSYCTTLLQKVFLKEFNTSLESNYCILIDEVEADFSDKGSELARVLKHIITEKHIGLEGKGIDIKNGMNNANLFLATNKPFGVRIEHGDRRFIVGARQEQKVYKTGWWPGDNEMTKIIAGELEEFVFYLKQCTIKSESLNRVVENEAREEIIGLSKTHTDLFFEAVHKGDFLWFQNNIRRRNTYNGSIEFEEVNEVLSSIRASSKVKRDDLILLFTNIIGKEESPASFSRKCTEHQIEMKPVRIDGDTPQGVEIPWTNEELLDYKKLTENNNDKHEEIKQQEEKGQLKITV